jgi:hypothetical protein
MTTDNRTVTGFESRELLPVAGLGLGLAVLGAVVQRAETTGLGGRIVLGLVPVASIPPSCSCSAASSSARVATRSASSGRTWPRVTDRIT